MEAALEGQLQPRRQAEPGGGGLHLLGHRRFRLLLGVGMRGDEEIQRADGCAFALEVGADLSVVAGIFKAKIDHSEQIEEGIEGGSFVGSAGFLDARPKFRCDETGDRRVLASWKSIEGGLTAQNLDAGARVEHVERAHEEGYLLPFQDGPFVFLGPGGRIGKVGGFRIVF